MSEYTPNLNLFKYNTSTDGKEIFSITQALNRNWDILDNLGSGRNIGEIVASTIPLTDAGLHLLDGALVDGSGAYSAFYEYMVSLWNNGYTQLFWGESDWQSCVTNHGVCGKFVLNEANRTIRLPKITGIVEGTTDVSALGDLVEAGLPNITGTYRDHDNATEGITASGCFSVTGASGRGAWNANDGQHIVTFDASRSSSIYGNSTTVQPQTIKVLYYIVIATSTKTDIQVDLDQIATDLNGKADVDLTNVHNSKAILSDSSVDGTSWYRVYSDGWCEQGGKLVINSANVSGGYYNSANLTLLKPLTKLCSYYVQTKHDRFNAGFADDIIGQSASTVNVYQVNDSSNSFANPYVVWRACGYIN